MTEIVTVSALLLVALGFVTLTARRMRAAELADPIGRARFAAAFDGEGISPILLGHAYDALRRRLEQSTATDVDPTTELRAGLHLTRLDVEDVALLAIARTHGRIPRGEDLDRMDVEVRTAGDLVRFLAPYAPPLRPGLRIAG